MPDVPALPRPGDRLAGFRIERELGHGTTGVVYLAHQEGLERKVALKVVGRPLADDAAFRERFRREARVAAGLDHPNVVQVLETGEDDAHLWLAMRFVDGPDLRVLLRRTGRLEPEQAVEVVEQIAAALDAAHAAGLVHRDVKPGNVLIEDGPGRDLHVELADFGLARAQGIDVAEGTPGYAAPEQLAGEEAGPAADVFGLGCVLFELLTGTPPPAPVRTGPGATPWRGGGTGSAEGAAGAGRGADPRDGRDLVGGASGVAGAGAAVAGTSGVPGGADAAVGA
ncbi:serine/threonine-protein kinase, partial [Patulibacter minatonensis]|uniref:serine/threonine-protein kinase n=1 Tax=Patulibacter minatonensis TaxID=298163 RepID=UPI0012FB4EB1